MLVEALAAGVVGVALLWLVLQPVLAPGVVPEEIPELPDPEETPRGQALLALHEIDFDRATGKLSDVDYHDLHARYSAAALALLGATPAADDPVERLIASRAAVMAPGARHCRRHGVRAESEAIFCTLCGAGLLDSVECCVGCGTSVPADAVFCPGCGKRIENRE